MGEFARRLYNVLQHKYKDSHTEAPCTSRITRGHNQKALQPQWRQAALTWKRRMASTQESCCAKFTKAQRLLLSSLTLWTGPTLQQFKETLCWGLGFGQREQKQWLRNIHWLLEEVLQHGFGDCVDQVSHPDGIKLPAKRRTIAQCQLEHKITKKNKNTFIHSQHGTTFCPCRKIRTIRVQPVSSHTLVIFKSPQCKICLLAPPRLNSATVLVIFANKNHLSHFLKRQKDSKKHLLT